MFPGDMRLCHSTYFLIEKNPCPELQTWLQTIRGTFGLYKKDWRTLEIEVDQRYD